MNEFLVLVYFINTKIIAIKIAMIFVFINRKQLSITRQNS